MLIKVTCPCSARFEFEVEPVNGRMPVALACPKCGADATELANAAIRSQTQSSPRPGTVAVRVVRVGTPAATTVQPAPQVAPAPAAEPVTQPVAVAVAPSQSLEEPAAPAVVRCPKHPEELGIAECVVCGKPVCARCMEQFGFLCSVYCQQQAAARKIKVPVYEGQRIRREATERRKGKRLLALAGVLAVLLVVAWGYYRFYASKPRPALAWKPPGKQHVLGAQWVGAEQVAVLADKQLTLLELGGREVWTTLFQSEDQVPSPGPGAMSMSAGDDDSSYFGGSGDIVVAGKDLWVVLPKRVTRFDATSGKREQDIPVPQPSMETHLSANAILLVSAGVGEEKILTRIDLAARKASTETVGSGSAPRTRVTPIQRGPGFVLRADSTERFMREEEQGTDVGLKQNGDEFIPAGPNVAHLATHLVAARVVTREMAQAETKSMLDSGTLRAADSSAAAREFLKKNDGPEQVDESTYRVTLSRIFGGSPNSWSADVVGPPSFFALQTVDLLAAGQKLYVFDKNNQKLWEAPLTYPISSQFASRFGDASGPPAIEAGGRLYFWDQGMLTAFELRTGKVQWRLTNVGISDAKLVTGGRLIVSGTTAAPASIPTSRPIEFKFGIQPLTLGVEASGGKVLWQKEGLGEHLHANGEFAYVSRGQISGADIIGAVWTDEKVPVHHRIHRLDPASGEELWEFYRPRAPRIIEPSRNRILLSYPGEIQVLKFMAL